MFSVEKKDSYIILPNSDNVHCFGCSPTNASGLKMVFYTNENRDGVCSWISVPNSYCGWSNFVHGGIISTMLDEAIGWACLIIERKLLLSKNIAVDFLIPIFVDQPIRVEGSVLEIKDQRKGVMNAFIYNEKNDVCAKATSLVSLFTVESIRKMGAVEEVLLTDLERIMNLRSK